MACRETLLAVEAAIEPNWPNNSHQPVRDAPPQYRQAGDPMLSRRNPNITTCSYGSYGLDQCSTWFRTRDGATSKPNLSEDWLTGDWYRTDHDRYRAAGRTFRRLQHCAARDGGFELSVGTAEFGNGTANGASPDSPRPRWNGDRISLRQSDTAHGGHDTGAYGSPPAPRRRAAPRRPRPEALAADEGIRRVADRKIGIRSTIMQPCAPDAARPSPSRRLRKGARQIAHRSANSAGSPASVAFNVQGFVWVNKFTGDQDFEKAFMRRTPAGRQSHAVRGPGRAASRNRFGATL